MRAALAALAWRASLRQSHCIYHVELVSDSEGFVMALAKEEHQERICFQQALTTASEPGLHRLESMAEDQ